MARSRSSRSQSPAGILMSWPLGFRRGRGFHRRDRGPRARFSGPGIVTASLSPPAWFCYFMCLISSDFGPSHSPRTTVNKAKHLHAKEYAFGRAVRLAGRGLRSTRLMITHQRLSQGAGLSGLTLNYQSPAPSGPAKQSGVLGVRGLHPRLFMLFPFGEHASSARTGKGGRSLRPNTLFPTCQADPSPVPLHRTPSVAAATEGWVLIC